MIPRPPLRTAATLLQIAGYLLIAAAFVRFLGALDLILNRLGWLH